MEKRAYPKFTITAGGFAETPEGKALYARCQKDGDMAPYNAAKAAYAEACLSGIRSLCPRIARRGAADAANSEGR